MTELITSASIEIQIDESPTAKTLHLLKFRLTDALNEAALTVLDELGLPASNHKLIRLDTIEVVNLDEPAFSD